MKWFEEMLADVEGSDGKPLPGATPDQIAELASEVFFPGETMVDFIRGFFISQKRFSDFLGVGESTVAGWVKNQSIPAYAMRAGLAAYLTRKHWQDLKETRRDAERPFSSGRTRLGFGSAKSSRAISRPRRRHSSLQAVFALGSF